MLRLSLNKIISFLDYLQEVIEEKHVIFPPPVVESPEEDKSEQVTASGTETTEGEQEVKEGEQEVKEGEQEVKEENTEAKDKTEENEEQKETAGLFLGVF